MQQLEYVRVLEAICYCISRGADSSFSLKLENLVELRIDESANCLVLQIVVALADWRQELWALDDRRTVCVRFFSYCTWMSVVVVTPYVQVPRSSWQDIVDSNSSFLLPRQAEGLRAIQVMFL